MSDETPATKADLGALGAQLLKHIEGFEKRLTEYIDQRNASSTKQLPEYIDERTHDAETRLLRAFTDYQQSETTRFRHMKADLGNLNVATDERLAALEQRLTNIDKRLIEKGF